MQRTRQPLAVGLMPELSEALTSMLGHGVTVFEPGVPIHLAASLQSAVDPSPWPGEATLVPRPDPLAQARVRELRLTELELRLDDELDDPRVEQATGRLVEAFRLHLGLDLGVPAWRVEALSRALQFLLWFHRRYGWASPLSLDAEAVRSCFGNFYIRKEARPELTWIHYGLVASSVYAAFLYRLGWDGALDLDGLLALEDERPWYRQRLASFWAVDGAELDQWKAVCDYQAL